MLKKISLALLLSFSLSYAQDEPRAFYELLYGEHAYQADSNTSSLGFGLRFTYPASSNFYLGYKGEVGFTDSSAGYFGRLAFAADIRLSGDLFLTGDYGYNWGYDNVVDENGTSIGYSATPQSAGPYHTLGLRYMFSDFFELAIVYRKTAVRPFESYAPTEIEEVIYSFNFAITEASLHFFAFMFSDDY